MAARGVRNELRPRNTYRDLERLFDRKPCAVDQDSVLTNRFGLNAGQASFHHHAGQLVAASVEREPDGLHKQNLRHRTDTLSTNKSRPSRWCLVVAVSGARRSTCRT